MKNFFIVFALLVSISNVCAKDSADIFSGSTNSSILVSQSGYEEYKTSFGAAIGYDHAFTNGLQLGTSFSASIQETFNYFSLLIGPGYNFNSNDLENSFFVDLQAGGILINNDGFNSFDAMMALEIGKRFKLAEGISYVPGVSVVKVFGPNSDDPTFSINLFKFSILF